MFNKEHFVGSNNNIRAVSFVPPFHLCRLLVYYVLHTYSRNSNNRQKASTSLRCTCSSGVLAPPSTPHSSRIQHNSHLLQNSKPNTHTNAHQTYYATQVLKASGIWYNYLQTGTYRYTIIPSYKTKMRRWTTPQ